LDSKKKVELLLDVALGLQHLHAAGVIHRDIAARNCLLTAELRAKLSDFGMSRKLRETDDKGKTMEQTGPLRYESPESLRDRSYSPMSDMWTFGILIWETWTEGPPHANMDLLSAAVAIRDTNMHPLIPVDMPEFLAAICLNRFAQFACKLSTFDATSKPADADIRLDSGQQSKANRSLAIGTRRCSLAYLLV